MATVFVLVSSKKMLFSEEGVVTVERGVVSEA